MKILTKDEFLVNLDEFLENIDNGAIFIHPTDTIYGLGCDATNRKSVKRLRDIKDRHEWPFSVIAPSKEWIMENCVVNESAMEWLNKLPGPYTLVLKLKNKECIAANVNFDLATLGVRLPDHWFGDFVKRAGKPIVTTSANKTGEDFMTSIDNLNPMIEEHVEFIVYEEEKHGKPSMIVDLSNEKPIIKKR
jgi:L-threonylcarbamoyladenylate synthase